MNDRIERALDYIEDHLSSQIDLADIATAVHLSSYHFARLFRSSIGRAPMEYVRLRRLTRAVKELRQNPQCKISDLALECGFGSHQGFTTAFKREFQIAPASYRGRQFALPIQEPIVLGKRTARQPAPPDFRFHPETTITGLHTQFNQHNKVQIPQLWGQLNAWRQNIPGRQGVCLPGATNEPGNFGYLAGVPVVPNSDVPAGLASCTIPASRYAVFSHEGRLDFLQDTLQYIFGIWAPATKLLVPGAIDFERYDERFDATNSSGIMEIWVPVKS